MDYQNVTVTVPATRVGDLLSYAADLARSVEEPSSRRTVDGVDQEAVRKAYLGGESVRWRPFLEVLASSPGEWVDWHYLCERINFTPARAAGMLGAAERRCHQKPPYEKKQEREQLLFRMPAGAAEVIRDLVSQRGSAPVPSR